MIDLSALITEGFGIIDKLVPDKDLNEKLKHEFKALGHKERMADKAINREEAKHASPFVAGWRPALGWCCGIILMYSMIVRDLLILYTDTAPPEVSDYNLDIVITITGALLGTNILARSVEKIKGVARKALK